MLLRVARRPARLALILLLSVFLPACTRRDTVKLFPVAGKVTIHGQPLRSGTLSFRPDRGKGNNSPYEPASEIDRGGNYQLRTTKGEGAPLGWYRVMLVCADPVDVNNPYAPRKSYVHAKYNDFDTTDLLIEVTENPAAGAYNLQVEP